MIWIIHILLLLFFWPGLIISILVHLLISIVNDINKIKENTQQMKMEAAERQEILNKLKKSQQKSEKYRKKIYKEIDEEMENIDLRTDDSEDEYDYDKVDEEDEQTKLYNKYKDVW